MRKKEKRLLLQNVNLVSAALMFISLLALVVIEQPMISGGAVSVSVSKISIESNPLGIVTSILISVVIVAAILFLGSKLMESRL